MCGIAGWLGAVPNASQIATEIVSKLNHRGPDSDGVQLWEHATLVHTRLSIIDLSSTGKQPMSNENGAIWTVFNGEIYNHRELRHQLIAKGHIFNGHSDTEILPHLYEEEGIDFVHKLRGMFAFAILDNNRNKLVIARDRFGIKPLFYTMRPEYFGFASELRALRTLPNVDTSVNTQALADFSALFYIPAPMTFFKGIFAVLPGEIIEIDLNNGLVQYKVKRYHQWQFSPDYSLTMPQAIERAEALCDLAVQRQLESDVPLGGMLSGGIDSSLVCTSAQRMLEGSLNTFNVKFSEAEYDETWAALAVADHIHSKHQTLEITAGQGTWEHITNMLIHIGQPFADTSVFAVEQISQLMRQKGAVALSGDGGDEGFGGYKAYGRIQRLALLNRLPAWLWRNAGQALAFGLSSAAKLGVVRQHLSARVRDLAKSNDLDYFVQKLFCVMPDEEHKKFIRNLDVEPIQRLFVSPLRNSSRFTSVEERLSAQITEASLNIEMPNAFLFKTDIGSMRHGLEIRVPMLDEELFQFGLSLPYSLKVSQGKTKAVLRQIALRRLPSKVAHMPKHGFSMPVDKWVNAEFKAQLREVLLGSSSILPRFFDPNVYRPIVEAFCSDQLQPHVARSVLYRRAIMLLAVHISATNS